MRKKEYRLSVAHFLVIGVLTVLLTASFIYGGLLLYTSGNTVPSGTVVGGLEVGGLAAEEALDKLDDMIAELRKRNIRFSFRNAENKDTELTLTWEEAGAAWDAPDFRSEVLSLSAGSVWERAKTRKNFAKNWRLHASFHPSVLKKTFNPEWEKDHFGSPVNAVRSIAADDSIRYLPGKSAKRIDWESLVMLIQAAIPAPSSGRCGDEADKGSGGGHLGAVQVEIPLASMQPAVTVESLKREGIRRKIAEFSTGLQTSGEGRLHNVEAAARSIDGMVLPPGGIFDYAKVVEAAEQSYGFREAPVIFGGKLVPGVGGGICQVSSTLYNAAIRAGLDIVERRNHSLPVSYVPLGQDATFAQGYINFRFQNTSGQHLLITAQVKEEQLTIKLFGDMPDNVTYDIESRTTDILAVPDKYVANPGLSAGSREVVLQGKPGYIVETYRIKYIDGKATAKTRLSRDTYPAQPNVIAVPGGADGKAPAQQDTPRVLEDGVNGPKFSR